MRRIIGANESPSSVAVLVRMGVMPLQYELAYRALMWYLKIFKGETDPVLTEQLESMRSNDAMFSLTCFYKHCHNYVEQLSKLGEVNLFDCEMKSLKTELRKAMFFELNEYWNSLNEARVTKEIHPVWKERRLPSFMRKRYTHTVMHRLALGRGPLRKVIHRKHHEKLQKCRYGCDAKEDIYHVVLKCKKTEGLRNILKKQCLNMSLELICNPCFAREIYNIILNP